MEPDHDECHRRMVYANDFDWNKGLKAENCVKVNQEWDEALKAEDCVRVSSLLKKSRKLLKRGWEELKSSEAEDCVRVDNPVEKIKELVNRETKEEVGVSLQLQKRVWKGRTALHVAARRGDADLVQQIRAILHPKHGTCSTQCHLLEVVDRDYELDALAMAVVNGNHRIVALVNQASRDCSLMNPSRISHEAEIGIVSRKEGENKAGLPEATVKQLEKITRDVLPKHSAEYSRVKAEYKKDCDFNFLRFKLYLFHFTFSTWNSDPNGDFETVRSEIFKRVEGDSELLGCLLQLRDGQGRTPLHVAVESSRVGQYLSLRSSESKTPHLTDKFLNVEDSAGRTPLYRAAAQNRLAAVEDLLTDDRVNLNAEMKCAAHQWGLDIDKLSWKNKFKSDCVYILDEKLKSGAFNNKSNSQDGPGPHIKPLEEVSSTALHVAMIHKHFCVVKHIVDVLVQKRQNEGDTSCHRRFTWPVSAAWKENKNSTHNTRQVTTMKLAVLVGDIPILQHLLKAEERLPKIFTSTADEKDLSSFHLAAAVGNPGIVKAFLDSEEGRFNPRRKDILENTALHHALKGKHVKLRPHLVDFVGCRHVFYWRWENDDWISEWLASPHEPAQWRRVVEDNDNVYLIDRYTSQRLGSINLLLEAGISIWNENRYQRTANPEPSASEEFVKWWYEKVAREMQQGQEKLSAAANAISVTAALVATASYLGPLQPPLGYDGGSLQMKVYAVRIFVLCDSMSFYLALAAIMLALLPSLPLPQESMFRELIRTRILVAVAVTFLFPSIVCVLVAFAAGYIAVIPDHGLAHHGLIVATACVGGLLCLLVMIPFLARLVTVYLTLPKCSWKKIVRFVKDFFDDKQWKSYIDT